MKLTEIIKQNRDLGSHLTGEKYKIKVLSNVTTNQIKEILEYTLRDSGINAYVEIGNYDSIIQDSTNLSGYNAVVVFWESCNLIENLHVKCNLLSHSLIDDLKNRVEGEINLLLKNLRKIPLVLLNRFSSLAFDADPIIKSPLNNLCKHFNKVLENNCLNNIKLVDIDMILAKSSLNDCVDYRQFQIAKALYTVKFYKEYVKAIKPAFMSVTGQIKKLLILDCDNTLWKGVLGEEGYNGIQMNHDSIAGKPYYEIQSIIKSYKDKGMLLALCSKNNLNDVERVLSEHPDMILKNEDFVAKKINWENKAKNISDISHELNLGLDSFIFFDDSKFELGLVEKELPKVKCIPVPNNISDYPLVVREMMKEFDHSDVTSEDKNKTKMYLQEQERKQQSNCFDSMEEYLASLNLKVNFMWNENVPVSRASQMTQKTNQFNLTTKRYTEADIQRMLDDDLYSLTVFSVTDRYGDYGVTGLAIITRAPGSENSALVDSFLMSCRIIGRNIEYAVFHKLVSKLKDFGIDTLWAEYLETEKNKLVESFYDSLGFESVYSGDRFKKYKICLKDYNLEDVHYIKTINKG